MRTKRERYDTPEKRAKHCEYMRKWRIANPDYMKQYMKTYVFSDEQKAKSQKRQRKNDRKSYGIVDPSDETRNGNCEICNREGKLHFDHDHTNGLFRGWICGRCNRGLGLLGDSVEGVAKALDYLRRTTKT